MHKAQKYEEQKVYTSAYVQSRAQVHYSNEIVLLRQINLYLAPEILSLGNIVLLTSISLSMRVCALTTPRFLRNIRVMSKPTLDAILSPPWHGRRK